MCDEVVSSSSGEYRTSRTASKAGARILSIDLLDGLFVSLKEHNDNVLMQLSCIVRKIRISSLFDINFTPKLM